MRISIRHTLLAILLASSTLLGHAQSLTLRGTVRNGHTKAPLAGATVMEENSNRYTTTDQKGRYRLTLTREPHTVVFGYMGFSPKKIAIPLRDSITLRRDIFLDSAFVDMAAVYVGSQGSAKLIRESAPPVTVISADQLQGSVSSVEDILLRMTGVTLRTTGGVGASARISVRGLEGKRIAIFLDESPIGQHSDFVSINDIPLDMIERIEVYKGVVPFNLGGAALGGAINVVLKEYPPHYRDFSYEGGSYNLHRISMVNKINREEQGILVGFGGGATYAKNNYMMDVPDRKGLRVRRDHDDYFMAVFGGGVEFAKSWFDECVIEPAATYSYRQMQGVTQNIQHASTQSAVALLNLKLAKAHIGDAPFGFEYRMNGGYGYSRLVDTSHLCYNWDGSSYQSPSAGGGEIGRFVSNSTTQRGTINSNLFLNYFLTPNHTMHFCATQDLLMLFPEDAMQEKVIGFQMAYNATMLSSVLALDYQWRSDSDIWLNAITGKYFFYTLHSHIYEWQDSQELERITSQHHDWGVSDALRVRLSHDLLLKGSVSYASRLPSEGELIGNGLEVAPSIDLRPEKNFGLNLGLLFSHRFSPSRNVELEVNGFYNYLDDMIRFTKGFVLSGYENFGSARTLGGEIELKGDMLSWLYGYANCTYQDQRDRREKDASGYNANPSYGLRLPNIPYLMGNAGLELHRRNLFGGKGQNSRLNIDASYIHEYLYDFKISQWQTRRIPTSLSFDASIEHSIMGKTWTFTAKFFNITNQKLLTEFNRPLPGFRFALKVRYLFK